MGSPEFRIEADLGPRGQTEEMSVSLVTLGSGPRFGQGRGSR